MTPENRSNCCERDHLDLLEIPINPIKRNDIVDICKAWLSDSGKHYIVTANAEILIMTIFDENYKKVIKEADLITADGMGVRWASAFSKKVNEEAKNYLDIFKLFFKTLALIVWKPNLVDSSVPERVSGSDIIWDVALAACKENVKVFLLGGMNQTAIKAAKKIKEVIPEVDIHAYVPDHFASLDPSSELNSELERIKPEVVFVGYGSPKQELWISKNIKRYPFIKLAMGVGGTFDFIAGNVSRAPLKFQNHGLEWLWRLTHRPSRFFRALKATFVFPAVLLTLKLVKFKGR